MDAEAVGFKGSGVLEKSLRRRVLDGIVWLTALRVFGQAISWTITVYVVRILSPQDYGLMAMSGLYVSFIALFNEVGLGTLIVQRKNLTQEDISSIGSAILVFNASLYVLSFLLAPIVAFLFNEPRLVEIIRVSSAALIIQSVGIVSYNLLSRQMAFDRRSQAEMIGALLGALSVLWLAIHGFGVWSLVFGNIVIDCVKNSLFVFFCPWRPKFAISPRKIKELLPFGSKVVLARFFWYFASRIDFMIAGRVLGKTQLGHYAIALQFASIPLDKIASIITQIALPAFSQVQDDHVALRRVFLKIVKFLAIISFPIFWGIFLLADYAIPLLLSDKWSDVILPLQILCVISGFRAIESMNAPLAFAIGRPDITMVNNLLMGAVLGLSFFIGSMYGLNGLAYSWLIFPAISLITTWISARLVGITLTEYVKQLKHPFLGTVFMVVVVFLAQNLVLSALSPVAHVVVAGTLGVGFYFLYQLLLNRLIFVEARDILKR